MSAVLSDLITREGTKTRLVRLLLKNSDQLRVSCGVQSSGVNKQVYELPAIESLGVKTACIQGVAAVLNPGVHGSRSSGYGGDHHGSPELLFIGKGPSSGLHRGVGVGGTDQLSLSPLSEREEPNQPLSITSYTLRRFIYSMLATTESGV